MPLVRSATHAGTWYSSQGGIGQGYLKSRTAPGTPHCWQPPNRRRRRRRRRAAASPCPACTAGTQLRQQLSQWLDEAEAVEGQHARIIIAPHAGYRYAAHLLPPATSPSGSPPPIIALRCLTLQVLGARGGICLQADRPQPSVSAVNASTPPCRRHCLLDFPPEFDSMPAFYIKFLANRDDQSR